MAIERFSHLFLPGPSDTRDDYSNPRRGGAGPRLTPGSRDWLLPMLMNVQVRVG